MRQAARAVACLFGSLALGAFGAANADMGSCFLTRHVVFEGNSHGHHFRLTLIIERFNARAHHSIEVSSHPAHYDGHLIYAGNTFVDGRYAIGTDGGAPFNEITSARLNIDGKPWPVPSRLWRDVYNLELDADRPSSVDHGFDANVDAKGDKFWITFNGSDGAGSYRIAWTIPRHGRVARTWTDLG